MRYRIAVRHSDEGYSVSVPGLPCCWSQSATDAEAVENIKECAAQTDACMDNLMKHEPLINKDIEKRRMVYTLRNLMLTPEAAEIGMGDVKDNRMVRAIVQINESYGLPRNPAPSEVFNRSFLPPKAERMVTGNF